MKIDNSLQICANCVHWGDSELAKNSDIFGICLKIGKEMTIEHDNDFPLAYIAPENYDDERLSKLYTLPDFYCAFFRAKGTFKDDIS